MADAGSAERTSPVQRIATIRAERVNVDAFCDSSQDLVHIVWCA